MAKPPRRGELPPTGTPRAETCRLHSAPPRRFLKVNSYLPVALCDVQPDSPPRPPGLAQFWKQGVNTGQLCACFRPRGRRPWAGGYRVEPRRRVRTGGRARLPRSAGRPGPQPAQSIRPPCACGNARPLPASRRDALPEGAPRTAARGEGGVRGAGRERGHRRKWGAAGSAGHGQEGCTSRGWERSETPESTHGVRSVVRGAGGGR